MRLNSSRSSWAKAALLTAGLLTAGCAATELPLTGPWPTGLHDDARTNLQGEAVSVPLALAWDKDISRWRLLKPFPKEQLSSPALSGGSLYVGSTNESFYAMDILTGSVKWRFDASSPLEASPAVTGEMVCFGSSDGKLRCLDHEGKLIWEFQSRSEILSSPVVRDGRLYFNSSDDRAYALDAATGQRLWSYSRGTYKTVSPRIYGSPAYSDKGTLFYLFSDGTLAAVSAETGTEAWSKPVVKDFDRAGKWRRTPLYSDGTVYVIDGSDAVVAMSEETGEVRGVYNIIKARDFVLAGGRALVIAGQDQLVAMDRLSGAILWKREIDKGALASIFATSEHVFVITRFKKPFLWMDFLARDKGRVEALKLSDGSTAWAAALGSGASAGASAAYSRVALLTDKGSLMLFGPK